MESAKERKERLKRLRQEAQQTQNSEEQPSQKKQPTLKFRNYQIQSETIAYEKIEAAKVPTIEAKKDEGEGVQEDDQNVINVAPKKANWDLKRDVQKQLQILERRTNRALAQLLLESIKKEQEQQLLQNNAS
eukprot:TRINITY_DN5104_c0_g2_i3.p3 TRINITY_DN5104_c0_g2~~TRINITY_DN5104_c0_g2_i3.p3  ORF type:complete len:132 (-),score=19.57 TRINITY_DN5104_c0_g2_i3:392-787(-)